MRPRSQIAGSRHGSESVLRQTRQPSLDSASRRAQTAAVRMVLTVEADPDGHSLAEVVRIVLEELRDLSPGGDR